MTKKFNITFNGLTSSPDPFTEWFEEERGTGIDYEMESDVDDTLEDDYSEDA